MMVERTGSIRTRSFFRYMTTSLLQLFWGI